jgi:response regulator NasT
MVQSADQPGHDEDVGVLVVDGREEVVSRVATELRSRGCRVVDLVVGREEVADVVRRERPDVAVIVDDGGPDVMVELVREIVATALCPVVALLPRSDADFVSRAAEAGLFSFALLGEPEMWPAAIAMARERFHAAAARQQATERLAALERAKGVLMERHNLDEPETYRLLRNHARRERRPLLEVADEILSAHALLTSSGREPSQ